MEMDVDDVGSRPANVGVGAVTALDGEHLMALLLQVTKRGLNLGEQPDLCDRLFEVVGTVLAESRKPATGAVRYWQETQTPKTQETTSSRANVLPPRRATIEGIVERVSALSLELLTPRHGDVDANSGRVRAHHQRRRFSAPSPG